MLNHGIEYRVIPNVAALDTPRGVCNALLSDLSINLPLELHFFWLKEIKMIVVTFLCFFMCYVYLLESN